MGADNGPAMLPDGYRNKVYDHPKDAQDDLSKLAELAGLKVRANQSNPNYPDTKTLYYRVPNSPILGFEV
ncbi:hypothetical protein LAN33_24980, partial [Mycobacterium tuberculosis]|nr:hypothetical protein [Mycobacterium tuberculosis]